MIQHDVSFQLGIVALKHLREYRSTCAGCACTHLLRRLRVQRVPSLLVGGYSSHCRLTATDRITAADCGLLEMTNASSAPAVSQLPLSQRLEDLLLAGGRLRWRDETAALTRDPTLSSAHQQLSSTVLQLQSANYVAVLSSPDATALFAFLSSPDLSPSTVTADWLTSQLSTAVAAFVRLSSEDETIVVQTRLLLVAIAVLQAFVSLNWAGLPLPVQLLAPNASGALVTAFDSACHSILALDGEDVFEQSAQPLLLTLAHLLLVQHSQQLGHTRSAGWWSLRLLAIHHAMMETNTTTVKQHLDKLIPTVLATYDTPIAANQPTSLAARVRIEVSALQLQYWQYDAAQTCLRTAQSVVGLSVAATGVMGKRTKWQQEKKSQLVVTAQGRPEQKQAVGEEVKESHGAGEWQQDEGKEDDERYMPAVQQLDSDVLLPSLALDHDMPSIALSAVQRGLLLALSHFLTTAASTHITLREQQLAYLHTILAPNSQRSWAIEQCALYHRSLLELEDKHKQDRALQQLEDMCQLTPTAIDSNTDDDSSTERRVRMEDVYVSGWPAVWRVKLEVGGWFQQLGLLRSALELFESMQWMDGIIEMNVALQRRSIAEDLIRSRLASAPTPKLHCLLADLTGDITQYEAAWQLSNSSYPRAQRSLARQYRDKQEWAASIAHSQLALRLNPVFPMEWFSVGHCHLQLSQFEEAAVAFAKVVSYNPDYADGWNNLAACHLHVGADASAVLALVEAVRLNWDSWRVWDNMLLAAVRVKDWSRAMQAVERVMALKEKSKGVDPSAQQQEAVDVAVVELINAAMVDEVAVSKAIKTADEFAAESWRRDRWDKVLQSLLERSTTDPRLWHCEATWRHALGKEDREVEAHEKAYRTSLLPIPTSHPNARSRYSAYQLADSGAPSNVTGALLVWSSHPAMFDTAVDMLLQLLRCYENRGTEQSRYAAQLAADGFVDSVSKKVEGAARARWEERRQEVEAMQKTIADERHTQRSGNGQSSSNGAASAAAEAAVEGVGGRYASYASMWR